MISLKFTTNYLAATIMIVQNGHENGYGSYEIRNFQNIGYLL